MKVHSFVKFENYIFGQLIYRLLFVHFSSGSKIFSTFIGFLKSKDPNDGTEQALLNELSSFNDYLKDNVRLLFVLFVISCLGVGSDAFIGTKIIMSLRSNLIYKEKKASCF